MNFNRYNEVLAKKSCIETSKRVEHQNLKFVYVFSRIEWKKNVITSIVIWQYELLLFVVFCDI